MLLCKICLIYKIIHPECVWINRFAAHFPAADTLTFLAAAR